MVKPLQLVNDTEMLEVLEVDIETLEVTEVLQFDTEVLEVTEVLQFDDIETLDVLKVDTEVLKYVAVAVSGDIWVQLSKPCSKKDAQSFKGCQLRNETFKVVTETIFNEHLKKIT